MNESLEEIVDSILKTGNHHSFLIEGDILIFEFFKDKFRQKNEILLNAFSFNGFGIDDGRAISKIQSEKAEKERLFLIYVENFSYQAIESLLKMFEEPKQGTKFLLVTPFVSKLTKTFLSRFVVLKNPNDKSKKEEFKQQSKIFFGKSKVERLAFIKEIIDSYEDIDNNIFHSEMSLFLEELISAYRLNGKMKIVTLERLLSLHQFSMQKGASFKMILECVALIV